MKPNRRKCGHKDESESDIRTAVSPPFASWLQWGEQLCSKACSLPWCHRRIKVTWPNNHWLKYLKHVSQKNSVSFKMLMSSIFVFWMTNLICSANWFSKQLSCPSTQEYSSISHTEKRHSIPLSHHTQKSTENDQRRECKAWSYELKLSMWNSQYNSVGKMSFLT